MRMRLRTLNKTRSKDGAPCACGRCGAARCHDSVRAVLSTRIHTPPGSAPSRRYRPQPTDPPPWRAPRAAPRSLHNTPAPSAYPSTPPAPRQMPPIPSTGPNKRTRPTQPLQLRGPGRCASQGVRGGAARADTVRAPEPLRKAVGVSPSCPRLWQTPLTCRTCLLRARRCAVSHPATPAGPRQAGVLRRQSIHTPRIPRTASRACSPRPVTHALRATTMCASWTRASRVTLGAN